ncbi:unnamed protein product [Acanthoscelides obtectus]|uniref:Uncharacterized protein n=1 Tax=Acanthoscelides obtectus TaxID=200917 RepID=A0A9P0P0F3_ACAOB|nr:unnamed protein product [Acanthoscelides obtectus]CAK1642215.1 hypothetical protein AOBTE_LOCUS12892 [Acanthoscelides obtectus]
MSTRVFLLVPNFIVSTTTFPVRSVRSTRLLSHSTCRNSERQADLELEDTWLWLAATCSVTRDLKISNMKMNL